MDSQSIFLLFFFYTVYWCGRSIRGMEGWRTRLMQGRMKRWALCRLINKMWQRWSTCTTGTSLRAFMHSHFTWSFLSLHLFLVLSFFLKKSVLFNHKFNENLSLGSCSFKVFYRITLIYFKRKEGCLYCLPAWHLFSKHTVYIYIYIKKSDLSQNQTYEQNQKWFTALAF